MALLKKIDKLVITSLIPPFILAFFIAVFVLLMQFLWSFIDELVGKGIGALDLAEMLFYRSLSLFPMAFPIGILLSSVMVFGGLSERYELSSLKSAGVSLLRIMGPAIAFATVVACFSVFCSNTLIPLSNLKFQSRLYDMRNQKPGLSLIEGIFNDDFKGYSIHIGKKHSDNRRIENVVIYDQSTTTRRLFSMVTADHGEMFLSPDKHDFVMKLYDGYHYQEVDPEKQRAGFPFTRTKFREWNKKFSLSEFDLSYTDEDLFKTHHSMKSVGRLIYEIDTIGVQYDKMLDRNLYDFRKIGHHKPAEIAYEGRTYPVETAVPDVTKALNTDVRGLPAKDTTSALSERKSVTKQGTARAQIRAGSDTTEVNKTASSDLERIFDTVGVQVTWDSVYALLPATEREQFEKQALAIARTLQQNNQRLQASLKGTRINKAKHVYELHSKFSFAVICIVFLFIGAPMGAIVRKGGFGYPLLIAVIFFTIFILLTLMFKKLSETESVNAVFGAWVAVIVMLPISAILTYKSLNDAKMINTERWVNAFMSVSDWVRSKRSGKQA